MITVTHRRYVPYSHAHYAGNLVDGDAAGAEQVCASFGRPLPSKDGKVMVELERGDGDLVRRLSAGGKPVAKLPPRDFCRAPGLRRETN